MSLFSRPLFAGIYLTGGRLDQANVCQSCPRGGLAGIYGNCETYSGAESKTQNYFHSEVWCQDIELGSEVELTRQRRKDDHLVLVFDQRFHDPKITAYFACLGKGQFEMSKSLRSLKQEMPYSKVKLYHPKDVEVEVYSKKTGEEVLELLDCPRERMQAQQVMLASHWSILLILSSHWTGLGGRGD